uniref:Uncharacterized protein n=1 Tax=Magallana gigas TaxID=29159 RepID=K1PZU0_MAGGI
MATTIQPSNYPSLCRTFRAKSLPSHHWDGKESPAVVSLTYPNVRRHFRSSPEGNEKP